MHDLLPLQMLSAGKRGCISQIVGGADEVHRLQELGLREGVEIEMVQSGSPCIVKVGGSKLCFRDNEAFGVLVRPADVALGDVA